MVVALNFPLTKKYEFSNLDCSVSAKSFVPLQQLHRRDFLGSLLHTDTWGVPGWHFVLSHWLLFHKLSKEMRYADSNAFDTVLKWWPAEPFKSNWILHPSHFTIGAQGRSKLSWFPESSRAAEIFWVRISPFTDIQSLGIQKIHSFISRVGWKILGDFGEKAKSLKFAFFP